MAGRTAGARSIHPSTDQPIRTHDTGLMQQHLTRKIVNTDVGYLSAWSSDALDLVRGNPRTPL